MSRVFDLLSFSRRNGLLFPGKFLVDRFSCNFWNIGFSAVYFDFNKIIQRTMDMLLILFNYKSPLVWDRFNDAN